MMATISHIGKSSFADNLTKARELRELSQSELARISGLQPSSIAHFEAGRREPSCTNIRRLALALQVSSDYLIGICAVPVPATGQDPITKAASSLYSVEDRDLALDFIVMLQKRSALIKAKGEAGQ